MAETNGCTLVLACIEQVWNRSGNDPIIAWAAHGSAVEDTSQDSSSGQPAAEDWTSAYARQRNGVWETADTVEETHVTWVADDGAPDAESEAYVCSGCADTDVPRESESSSS